MNPSELHDLKQLALHAELARPLAHECNNFLNNLLLQLAISEKAFPEASRAEWANLRREGKKLASLFQQWQRLRKSPSEGPAAVELNELINEVATEVGKDFADLQILFRPSGVPVKWSGFAGDFRRLLSLLLGYAVDSLRNNEIEAPAIEIELAAGRDCCLVRLRSAGPAHGRLQWSDFNDVAPSERLVLSLTALACKSLAQRLDGNIRLDGDVNGSTTLTVELPRRSS